MIWYLVSGDPDILPSHKNLRRRAKRVRHDTEVGGEAAAVLKGKKPRYVVIAHGQRNGTITWYRTDWGHSKKWLYVRMERPPRGARVYLYSCHAGLKLPKFLKKCEVFGHVDAVPTPVDDARDLVLRYLDEVEKLMAGAGFDREAWRLKLGGYVNSEFVKATEKQRDDPGDIALLRKVAMLVYLRRSLGYPDP